MKMKITTLLILCGLVGLWPYSVMGEGGHSHGEEEELIKVSDEALRITNVTMEEVGARTLSLEHKVNGRIAPVASGVAHLSSRLSGVIREVKKDLGDTVNAGDVLAIVESNQNLQKFELRALQGGTVTDRHATIGESIKEDEPLFVIMDLTKLWADFTLFQKDVPVVKAGQQVKIFAAGRADPFISTVSFISPVVDETTQSRICRAVISNPEGSLAPGAFVIGKLAIGEYRVSMAVNYEAIQSIEGKSVVFVREEKGFEKREVSLGRSDGSYVEVLSGLNAGEFYAANNSFVLKAELGKSEAEHSH